MQSFNELTQNYDLIKQNDNELMRHLMLTGPHLLRHNRTKAYKYPPLKRHKTRNIWCKLNLLKVAVCSSQKVLSKMPFERFKCTAKKCKQNMEEGQSSNPPMNVPRSRTRKCVGKTYAPSPAEGQDSKAFKNVATPHDGVVNSRNENRDPPVISNSSAHTASHSQRELSLHERYLLLQQFSSRQVDWLVRNSESKVGDFVDMILASGGTSLPPRDDDQPAGVDSESEEMVSLRHCTVCDGFGCKEDMAKCRECGYWYHTECAGEPERRGKEDPNFSFWLCPKCKLDPKGDPGYKSTRRSKEDIDKDRHYEDSDYEMEPDYRMWK